MRMTVGRYDVVQMCSTMCVCVRNPYLVPSLQIWSLILTECSFLPCNSERERERRCGCHQREREDVGVIRERERERERMWVSSEREREGEDVGIIREGPITPHTQTDSRGVHFTTVQVIPIWPKLHTHSQEYMLGRLDVSCTALSECNLWPGVQSILFISI